MALQVVCSSCEGLVGEQVTRALRAAVGERGSCVLLVPSFAQALEAQKSLAHAGLGMGVDVGTPRSWARDRWDVWGDGRRVVDATQRTLVMAGVLEAEGATALGGAASAPGTIRLLCEVAERCLPWVGGALPSVRDELTEGETRALELLGAYGLALGERGLVECAEVMEALPDALADAGVAVPPVVCVGFSELSFAERVLLLGLARHASVTYVTHDGHGPAFDGTRAAADLLVREAARRGVAHERLSWPGEGAPERVPELASLCMGLFCAESEALGPTGAVRLLEAAGPLAEAELVACEVECIAQGGAGPRVAVVVPDVRRAWRELAPKLEARGVEVRAQLSVPVLATEAGRAFMGYARSVARLAELAASWPEPEPTADGPCVRLGPMDWWPPAELTDFLMCGVSGMEPSKATALDLAWRGDRLLSPADVLGCLLSSKATSDAVERATRELLKGRLGSAASKLLAPYAAQDAGLKPDLWQPGATRSLAREEAVAALAAVMGVAGTLKELGVTADPTCAGAVSLVSLVRQAELALAQARVTLKVATPAGTEAPRAHVVLASRAQAAAFAPASFEAAVLCGLTSQELPVPTGDDLLAGLLDLLGAEPASDPLVRERSQFRALCALPRRELLLERTLFASDAHETYPAVMLDELFACYGAELPKVERAEDEARRNLSLLGHGPSPLAHETPQPSGRIREELGRLVLVPPEGQAELVGGLPVLSASQLESYLECPLKWFSLRRLRLADNDARFSPLEMGTFAHRVLELTYTQLFAEGRARLVASDADGMAHAHEVLDACFAAHEGHQRLRVGSRAAYQALIAHTSAEEGQMERLRQDLSTTLDYVAARLEGFEPRAFEWEFGRGRHTASQEGLPALRVARYAGVAVTGTVDRIDVDAHGQAVIIDYKHKGPSGFFGEYAVFGPEGPAACEAPKLPRRIQSLMYAQVVRRAFPDVRVVGALYLGTRGSHELSGAVDENLADAVFGGRLSRQRAPQVVVPRGESFGRADGRGMEALLDAVEEAVAAKVERLRAGYIEADPVDEDACSYCPVSNCDRRSL